MRRIINAKRSIVEDIQFDRN